MREVRTTHMIAKYAENAVGAAEAACDAGEDVRLPPPPASTLFWTVTAYNIADGTMPETPQLLPSINGFDSVATNSDGSIDLWFGPSKPAATPDSNFIQTVNGRNFIVALRLYSTGVEFFNQTLKPDDVVKVK